MGRPVLWVRMLKQEVPVAIGTAPRPPGLPPADVEVRAIEAESRVHLLAEVHASLLPARPGG